MWLRWTSDCKQLQFSVVIIGSIIKIKAVVTVVQHAIIFSIRGIELIWADFLVDCNAIFSALFGRKEKWSIINSARNLPGLNGSATRGIYHSKLWHTMILCEINQTEPVYVTTHKRRSSSGSAVWDWHTGFITFKPEKGKEELKPKFWPINNS